MRSPLLVEALLRQARDFRGASPGFALELVDAALLVVDRLPLAGQDLGARSRLVLRSNAYRANLFRILGELQAAASLWQLIGAQRRHFPGATQVEEAELLSLEASLRIDLREWEEAERLLAEAGGIYEATGDGVGAAKVLLQRGTAAEYSGRSEAALALYQEAAETIDAEAEPALFLLSRMNAANALVDLGRPAEARALLAAHRELPERHGDPPTRLRWRWTGARAERAEERFTEAEAGFSEVANGLLALRRPYDAALALLDTAELFLAQGAWRKVRGLAERLEVVFEARGVHLEARKALILFQQAARAERLTAEWLGRLRRYLLVARNDREFGFDPAAPG
jgi:tetratricopeptide (TPR) repeat protein